LFDVSWFLSRLDWWGVLDILLVALLFYWVLYLIRGTQAIQLIRGAVILALVMAVVASLLPFRAFGWLVEKGLPALLVAIPVIFQPELRRALERLGRTGTYLTSTRESSTADVIDDVCTACIRLSERRHGALIVLERTTGLKEYIETGVRVNSQVSIADLQMGLRHRASIGVTEETDAVTVVVSEETGIISVAHDARMTRNLDGKRLRKHLQALYPQPRDPTLTAFVRDVRDRVGNVLGREDH
jgi:diadenylate cyclase